ELLQRCLPARRVVSQERRRRDAPDLRPGEIESPGELRSLAALLAFHSLQVPSKTIHCLALVCEVRPHSATPSHANQRAGATPAESNRRVEPSCRCSLPCIARPSAAATGPALERLGSLCRHRLRGDLPRGNAKLSERTLAVWPE